MAGKRVSSRTASSETIIAGATGRTRKTDEIDCLPDVISCWRSKSSSAMDGNCWWCSSIFHHFLRAVRALAGKLFTRHEQQSVRLPSFTSYSGGPASTKRVLPICCRCKKLRGALEFFVLDQRCTRSAPGLPILQAQPADRRATAFSI